MGGLFGFLLVGLFLAGYFFSKKGFNLKWSRVGVGLIVALLMLAGCTSGSAAGKKDAKAESPASSEKAISLKLDKEVEAKKNGKVVIEGSTIAGATVTVGDSSEDAVKANKKGEFSIKYKLADVAKDETVTINCALKKNKKSAQIVVKANAKVVAKLAAEKKEAEEKAAAEKKAAEEKAAAEKAAAEKAAAEKAAAEKAAAEKAAAEKVAADKAAADKAAAEQAAAAQAPAAASGETQYVDASGNGLIKGSQNGIYHVPGSTYYNRTTKPEAMFKTVSEAQNAGYRAPEK